MGVAITSDRRVCNGVHSLPCLRYTFQSFGSFLQVRRQFLRGQLAPLGSRFLPPSPGSFRAIPCGSNSRLVLGRLLLDVLPEGLFATRFPHLLGRAIVLLSGIEIRAQARLRLVRWHSAIPGNRVATDEIEVLDMDHATLSRQATPKITVAGSIAS
jgi:hypothetical protein